MRNQPHKPNSEDVARLAGVSRSTVSRVINGYANVPDDTRAHVMDVIERNGYFPSISGQTLRGKRARCVGVFLGEHGWRDEAQAALLYAFSQCSQALGYMTLSCRVGDYGTPACGRRVREILCSGCVDAGIFVNPTGGEALIRQLLRDGQTIGTLGESIENGHERLFTIELDATIADQTVRYVRSLGYSRALLLGDFTVCPEDGRLLVRLINAAEQAGLELEYQPHGEGTTLEEIADAALTGVHTPKLIICADQAAAYAVYRAAHGRRLAVGREVSILGMGLLPPDLPLLPALTAFRFDPEQMVDSLTGRMIRYMEGALDEVHHERISCQWTEGESCAHYPMQGQTVAEHRLLASKQP